MKKITRPVLALAAIFVLQCTSYDGGAGYTGNEVVSDTLLNDTYPELYKAVYTRDASRLRPFLEHDLIEIRKQAWRALSHTPVDSLDRYIGRAKKSGLDVAWFALSLHSFSSDQLRSLEKYWEEHPDSRGRISLILGRQGDEESLNFLMDRLDQVSGRSYELRYALAVGRLMIENEIPPDDQLRLIETAFNTNQSMVTRAYLYGYYRGREESPAAEIGDRLYEVWKDYGPGASSLVDQYVVGILKGRVFAEVVRLYNEQGLLKPNVQLGIELGQTVSDLEYHSANIEAIKMLLQHDNPHVVQQTLQGLDMKRIETGSELHRYIVTYLLEPEETDPFVWLQALNTLSISDEELFRTHREKLNRIERNHPYLLPVALEISRIQLAPDRFLEKAEAIVEKGDRLRTMFTIEALSDFWEELKEDRKTNIRIREIRNMVFSALERGDRGIAYSAEDLLNQGSIFQKTDFERINDALVPFRLPADIEVYQAFGRIYKERFEQQAQPVIDSLASLGYAPLNRSLADQGWEVSVPEGSSTQFRVPDWERLWNLGVEPIWILKTEKGEIHIQMDILSAPATVSAIDSLTRAGAYDGVPFHRVVPNFVIQGGDVERADGFGGPDFVIPTEASEIGYYRGAVGIASAGPDTEGSQYFVMHQWKPHLNGRYTLFGVVTEGMDVVDRIVVGDRVERVHWEQ